MICLDDTVWELFKSGGLLNWGFLSCQNIVGRVRQEQTMSWGGVWTAFSLVYQGSGVEVSKAGSQGDGQILPSPDVPVVETVDDPHRVTVFCKCHRGQCNCGSTHSKVATRLWWYHCLVVWINLIPQHLWRSYRARNGVGVDMPQRILLKFKHRRQMIIMLKMPNSGTRRIATNVSERIGADLSTRSGVWLAMEKMKHETDAARNKVQKELKYEHCRVTQAIASHCRNVRFRRIEACSDQKIINPIHSGVRRIWIGIFWMGCFPRRVKQVMKNEGVSIRMHSSLTTNSICVLHWYPHR